MKKGIGEFMKKKDLLKNAVEHIDIKAINSVEMIRAMKKMSFSARDLASAADIYDRMLREKMRGYSDAGRLDQCRRLYAGVCGSGEKQYGGRYRGDGCFDCRYGFFEALGFKHYQGTPFIDDKLLRSLYIDRIYDTFISEDDLQHCDRTIKKIADALPPRPYSSREFIAEMGRYLVRHSKKKDSLVQAAYENHVPIFCPAFSDSSAGFGLVMHQYERPGNHLSIDSVKDFLELTMIKIHAGTTGLLMIGGGVPKNFAQDTVVCAEILGKEVPMHKYAVQITVADVRDGACSSSTLKEANSWGKVDSSCEQMVYAEATTVLPLLASYAYHRGSWKKRKKWELSRLFNNTTEKTGKKIK